MLRSVTLLVCCLVLSVLVLNISPSQAQGNRNIAYGESVTDQFTGNGVHTWVFEGDTGDQIAITLIGNSIAVDLTLQQPNGETIAGTVGDNPSVVTLEAELSEDGEYLIFAATSDPATSGAYSLTLTLISSASTTGTILDEILMVEVDRTGEDIEYPFVGVAGDTILISLTSPIFDTFVELRDPDGFIIAFDDDGGIADNSFIVLTLPVDGTYNVVVRAYNDEDIGLFNLSVVSFIPSVLEEGEAFAEVSDGTPIVYSLFGEPEEAISLILNSLDFDPIVSVRSTDGSMLAVNDDSETSINSQLDTLLSEQGLYFVVVESYDDFESGTFVIGYNASLESIAAATEGGGEGTEAVDSPSADAVTIVYGDQIDSSLDGEERRFSFTGTEGDVLTIEMGSNNLDAFISLVDEEGEIIGQDDDSGQAFNALLEVTLPADGTYIIVATVRVGNPIGTFTLRLTHENAE